MPNAVFIPAELNDLSVDVALGTPAQGAVLYRGAAKWNALAAGGAGQVLTSGGINANPSWAPVSPDLSAAVVLAPTTTNRNVVQPTGDAVRGWAVKSHSAGQSVPVFEILDDNGVALVQGGKNSTVSLFRITQSPTDPATMFEIYDRSGQPSLSFQDAGYQLMSLANNVNGTSVLQLFQTGPAQSANIWEFYDVNFNSILNADPKMALTWFNIDAAPANVQMARFVPEFASNTAGAHKARVRLIASDHNGEREGLRVEASGSAPMIGFLGAAAAVRQTLPAAASDPATTQALANALRSLAITFGLAN